MKLFNAGLKKEKMRSTCTNTVSIEIPFCPYSWKYYKQKAFSRHLEHLGISIWVTIVRFDHSKSYFDFPVTVLFGTRARNHSVSQFSRPETVWQWKRKAIIPWNNKMKFSNTIAYQTTRTSDWKLLGCVFVTLLFLSPFVHFHWCWTTFSIILSGHGFLHWVSFLSE